ncbi:ArsR/SmtB family transcription factor [Lutispora thermophila]|uniref:Regulatory protein, arsR family n=1 Tax=Lutispora thermophila DSM 19022 TaxID=1122184 RepID=A0A1M6B585_9FIRM|nr:winged helix-turn-helix domain-containing protein [Lutispora thermophila]SHI43891.1 regulatory protein, arsR family [Lutispora thermophila DSM 19022]
MDYKIEHNRAIEFVESMFKYTINRYHKINWDKNILRENLSRDILDFAPSKRVKNWLKYVDDNISPIYRNDLIFIANITIEMIDASIEVILEKGFKEPLMLIDYIKSLEPNELVELIYNRFDLELPFDSEDVLIKNALMDTYDEEKALLFMQIKNHPEEYKNKVIEVYEIFYNLYYQPFEEEVYTFMESKCEKHNKLFQNDPIEFLNTIGLADYTEFITKEKKLRMIESFYIDLGLFHYYVDDTFIILFGHSIEHKFNHKLNQEQCINLFKALSDETRLEIISMTSKRPWYNRELAKHFNLSTATLSYHLNLLLNLGILNFEPSIKNRYYYTTNKKNLKELFDIAYKIIVEQ